MYTKLTNNFVTHTKFMSLLLLCGHDFTKGDETLHGFSHYTRRTPTQMWQYMQHFFEKEEHRKWMHFVGDSFLYRKGLMLEQYMDNIVTPGVPIWTDDSCKDVP